MGRKKTWYASTTDFLTGMWYQSSLRLAWIIFTGRWRCRCCGEFYGPQCDYWCAQDGCTHGRL